MHYMKAIAMPVSRSFLFVPGDRADRFDKAAAAGAHDVILDLEDAVHPDAKEAARTKIAGWTGRTAARVRINGLETPWFDEDIGFARREGLRKLMIPKAEPHVVRRVRAALGDDVDIVALIETVAGLLGLRDLCAERGRLRLAFGNLDFSLDAGITETERELDPVRLQLALESRHAGLPAPIDGVFTGLSDTMGLAAQVKRAKALGLGGKLCIHPSQVAVVNAGWQPAPEELDWARRVIGAVEAGGAGVISLDGKMVDRPVVERAREILGASAAE